MSRYFLSIRQKILIGYLLFIAILAAGTVFIYVNLNLIQEKILFSNVISEFFDTILEIRRFEKNYFLYRTEKDFHETLRFIDKAEKLIDENRDGFNKLASSGSVIGLVNDLKDYRKNIEKLSKKKMPVELLYLEGQIRKTGKEIVTVAEDISDKEQMHIRRLFSSTHHNLTVSVVFLVIFGGIIGYALFRTVTMPLKLLEENMEKISSGRLRRMSIDSRDREIISLSRTFNKMLQELEWRQNHLVQSEKLASMGTMLFGVAHELNNPLSNISTSCEILKEEVEEADVQYKKELLSQIENETDRAKNIVRTVLEFSREGRKEIVNLRNAVNESIRLIKGDVPAKVSINVEIPEEIILYADKQKLQQVFLNLIKNAFEAIAGEGSIDISASADKGKDIEIRVKDTGIGMKPETVSKIFDPFFSRKGKTEGYGLGLFVVHNIIEEHGGSIDVKSEVGYGTTFLIHLPQRGIKDEK